LFTVRVAAVAATEVQALLTQAMAADTVAAVAVLDLLPLHAVMERRVSSSSPTRPLYNRTVSFRSSTN
jgi:hypothetical protein